MLRQAMRGLLPQEILKRKKFSLSVLADQWVREEIPDFAVDLLSKKRLRETGYFNSAFMNQMLNRHRKGEENFGRFLLGVLGIHLWHDLFINHFRITRKEFGFASSGKK
jgi:asparagine synthase (glutamine-hydrolysing)